MPNIFLSRTARRAEQHVKPICKYVQRNYPRIALCISIASLALQHFQEKEASTLNSANILSIIATTIAEIVDIYHRRGQVLESTPSNISGGRYMAFPATMTVEVRTERTQFFTLNEQRSLQILMHAFFAEAMFAIVLLLFTYFSESKIKMAQINKEILQFFVETAVLILEDQIYQYYSAQLRNIKRENRRFLENENFNSSNISETSSSDYSSIESNSSNSSEHSIVSDLSSSHHSTGAGAAFSESSLANMVRSFSCSHSDS